MRADSGTAAPVDCCSPLSTLVSSLLLSILIDLRLDAVPIFRRSSRRLRRGRRYIIFARRRVGIRLQGGFCKDAHYLKLTPPLFKINALKGEVAELNNNKQRKLKYYKQDDSQNKQNQTQADAVPPLGAEEQSRAPARYRRRLPWLLLERDEALQHRSYSGKAVDLHAAQDPNESH
jgi:hypothetical protein